MISDSTSIAIMVPRDMSHRFLPDPGMCAPGDWLDYGSQLDHGLASIHETTSTRSRLDLNPSLVAVPDCNWDGWLCAVVLCTVCLLGHDTTGQHAPHLRPLFQRLGLYEMASLHWENSTKRNLSAYTRVGSYVGSYVPLHIVSTYPYKSNVCRI